MASGAFAVSRSHSTQDASPVLIRRPGGRGAPRFDNCPGVRPSCGSRIKSGKASGMGGSAQWPVATHSTFPDFAPALTPSTSWPVLYRPPTGEQANHDPDLKRHGGWPGRATAMTYGGSVAPDMDGRRICHVRPPFPQDASPDLIRRSGDHGVPRFKNRFAAPPSSGSRIQSGTASGMGGSTQWPAMAHSTFPDFAPELAPTSSWPRPVPATHRRASKSRSRIEAAWWVAGTGRGHDVWGVGRARRGRAAHLPYDTPIPQDAATCDKGAIASPTPERTAS